MVPAKQELTHHDDLPIPASAMPDLLPTAMSRSRFRDWVFGTTEGGVQFATATRDLSQPGVLIRRETLQLMVSWQPVSDELTTVSWDAFDYSQGQKGRPKAAVANEFGQAMRFTVYSGALPSPPPVDLILRPGQPFDGRFAGNLRDYSFCANEREVEDFEAGVLPLGVHAFGDHPRDEAAPEAKDAVWYGKPLFLAEYRSGRPMLYNGVLVCAPQNSGKTFLVKRWAKAANAAGNNLLLVDVKGNLHEELLAAGWKGRLFSFSTNPQPGSDEPRIDRINFLAGYISEQEGISSTASDRLKQLATALLPSEGWTGQGGKDESFYRNRVIWLNALMHILLLRQIYYPWKFKDCRKVTRACRTQGTAEARDRCTTMMCMRSADLRDLYELAADERLLYKVIRELREAEAKARKNGNTPFEPGIDYWMRELALAIDHKEFPEGNRPPNETYQQYTAGIKQALEPFAPHGTLHKRICDNGPGKLFRLEDLGANEPDEPVTILLAARQQDHVNAETVLALVMARLQQLLFDRMRLPDPRPILLLLDETRRIRGFKANEYVTFAREAKAGCVLVYQSLDQIGEKNKINEILENVGTQIYLGSLVGDTARYFIDILPQRYRATNVENVQRAFSGVSRSQELGRELVPAFNTGDLYRLPAGKWPALVYVSDQPRRKPMLVDMDEKRTPAPRAALEREVQWRALGNHATAVRSAMFWPGPGDYVLSASEDETTIAWRIADQAAVLRMVAGSGGGRCAAAHPSGETLACGAANGRIALCSSQDGSVTRTVEAHTAPVNAVVFGLQGVWLASASEDRTIVVTDVASGELIELLTAHTAAVRSVSLSADGSKLLSTSDDGTARLWSAGDWRQVAGIDAGHRINDACCGPDGAWVLLGGPFGLRFWQGGELSEPVAGLAEVAAVSSSPDGTLVAVGAADGLIRLFSPNGWSLLATLPPYHAAVSALAFSSAGNRLVAAASDGHIRLIFLEPVIEAAARLPVRSPRTGVNANLRRPPDQT